MALNEHDSPIEALARSMDPIERYAPKGVDHEVWLVWHPWNYKHPRAKLYWVEARSTGVVPIGGPYQQVHEAIDCTPKYLHLPEVDNG